MAAQRLSRPTEQKQRHVSPSPEGQLHVQKHLLLQLQQTVGNQAFQQLLRSGVLQATLGVNRPGDRPEQVAEQVAQRAQQVMRMRERRPVEKKENAHLVVATNTPPPIPEPAKKATVSLPAVDEGASKESAAEAAIGIDTLQSPAPPEKAPASPEEDSAYQAVAKELGIKAKHERTPSKKPVEKETETIVAANVACKDIIDTQNAYRNHLDKLEQVQPHELTVGEFMGKFYTTIDNLAEKLPKKKEDRDSVHTAVELAAGGEMAKQEIASQSKTRPEQLRREMEKNANGYPDNQKQELATYELKIDPAGRTPTIQHAKTAATKPKTDDAISLDDQSRALDEALSNHRVSGQTINIDEGSLAFPVSGEKTFDEAGQAKRKAQDEIAKARPRYREEERGVISTSEDDMHSLVNITGLQGHHGLRSKSFKAVLGKQELHAGNIKKEKGCFFAQVQQIYEDTKNEVNKELNELQKPPTIEETFASILSKAENDFKDWVRQALEYIYPGFFEYSKWLSEHADDIATEYKRLLGEKYKELDIAIERLAKESKTLGSVARGFRTLGGGDIQLYFNAVANVQERSAKEYFLIAKATFIGNVKREVEEKIAKKVVKALNAAKTRIKAGKDQVKEAYARLSPQGLSPAEQAEAADVLVAVTDQFKTLEESVDDRQREIIDDMARTYNRSVGKLQSTFDEIKKQVLSSWIERAWNKLKAIVNAIIDFATRIAELLGRMISLLGDIVSSPRYFFNNLVTGIGRGFSTFADRIDEFLATAFFDWLRGASGIAIQLPKDWGPKGIFSLFTQLLNLSTETVWQRMEVVYDKTTANAFRRGEALLEKGLEIFSIIKNEGLGGLWEHIKESLGSILEDTLEMIKETVLYAAIKKVIFEIGKMLVPGGGFIAIAEKIIRLLQFIVEARNKILDLINSFVNSMANAVKGDIPGIVENITGALTKFITVALDFLVTFFGLGGLKEKVERFIERMRTPIIRGIDWVLGKVKPFVMRAMQKGKELVAKGKAALGLDIDKQVMLGKEKHTLRGHIEDDRVTILMSSPKMKAFRVQIDGIKDYQTMRLQKLQQDTEARRLAEKLEGLKEQATQIEIKARAEKDPHDRVEVTENGLNDLDIALGKIAIEFGFDEKADVKEDDLIAIPQKKIRMKVTQINVRQGSLFGVQARTLSEPITTDFFSYASFNNTWQKADPREPGTKDNPFILVKWPKPASHDYPTLYFGGPTSTPIPQTKLKSLFDNNEKDPNGFKIEEYTPHGGGELAEGGGEIGLTSRWYLAKNTIVGPLKAGDEEDGRKESAKLNNLLKRYGYDSTTDKMEVDHVHELQVGGKDVPGNLWPLDATINSTAGPTLAGATVEYPDASGTVKIAELKGRNPHDFYFFIKDVL